MSGELDAIKDIGTLLALGGFALKLWWDDREKKRAKLEGVVEANEQQTKSRTELLLEKVAESQARVEGELRDLRNLTNNQAGIVAAVDRRVEGLSQAYGPAIKNLELELARIQERMPKGKR